MSDTVNSATAQTGDSAQKNKQPHARIRQLLAACDELVREEILERLPQVIRELDDELFHQADRAANHNEQNLLFDARREFRRKSRAFLKGYEDALEQRFRSFLGGQAAEMTTLATKGELSLVEEDKLEEMLIVNSICDRLEGRELRRLHALNTRLSTVQPELKTDNETNPYSVRSFCECAATAGTCFEVSSSHKVLFFQHFERHALNNFGQLLESINQHLIKAGILPNLEFTIARNESEADPTSAPPEPAADAAEEAQEPAADAPAAQGSPPAHGAQPQMRAGDTGWNATMPPEYGAADGQPGLGEQGIANNEALAELRELLATSRMRGQGAAGSGQPMPGAAPAAGAAPASPNDLAQALSEMQRAARVGESAPQPAALKDHLMNQLGQLNEQPVHLTGEQTDTVELVGMLFQYIQREAELHNRVQQLVSRLQVPLLRVALEDAEFFTEQTHPARQLLNAVAHAGDEWLSDDDADSPVLKRLNKVTDRVLNEFRDDISVFKNLLSELRGQLETLKKRAEVNEKRQIEASKGREKLELARDRADKEIRLRLARAKPPDYVRGLLEEAWADVLALTVLRFGDRSDELRDALGVADDLIDCTVDDHTPEHKSALRKRTNDLVQDVRRGLAQVGFQGNDFDEIDANLKRLFSNALDERETADGDAVPPEPEPVRVRFGLSKVREKSTRPRRESIRLNEKEQAALSRLRKMPFGTWFEFHVDGRRRPIRWKLAWYSPVTSRCLFVNKRGARVDERSLQSLAREVAKGKARLYRPEEAPLFDRAINAILTRLRHMIQPTAKGTA